MRQIALCFFFLAVNAFGQWRTQVIELKKGWNAVYIEVYPYPDDLDVLLEGLPVDSLWEPNTQLVTMWYISDPSETRPSPPRWRGYFPPGRPERVVANLHALLGGHCYLVKVRQDCSLAVKGIPVAEPPRWKPDQFNLVGFAVDPRSPPTFGEFFRYSKAHRGQDIYRLKPDGKWRKVEDPEREEMKAGEAFWIYCRGTSDYGAPLQALLNGERVLDFRRTAVEKSFELLNHRHTPVSVMIRVIPSDSPPPGTDIDAGGPVPLQVWRFRPQEQEAGWFDLAEESMQVGPGGKAIRLQVKRNRLPAPSAHPVLVSLLEVRDGYGSLVYIPVRSKAENAGVAKAGKGGLSYTGLWVGYVSVNAVNVPEDKMDPDTPKPTGVEFSFKVIIHVDGEGRSRLLSEVTQLWSEGETAPDPDDPWWLITSEPGDYVLVTRDELLPTFEGVAIRDGRPFGRRISTCAYVVRGEDTMQGDFGEQLSVRIELGYDDALNPFKHKFHPDHDNFEDGYDPSQGSPEEDIRHKVDPDDPNVNFLDIESYKIERQMDFVFTQEDPDRLSESLPGWGDSQVGGMYKETLIGLHRKHLYVAGTFRLWRVAKKGVLNEK